jgi:ketosteroid isomerase-like protein
MADAEVGVDANLHHRPSVTVEPPAPHAARSRPTLRGGAPLATRKARRRLPIDNEAVVTAYFEAIRARDADALAGLFSADAELVGAAGTFRGRDAIAGFYRDLAFLVEDLWPEPGPLVVDGDRVEVEIQLRMNGAITPVRDLFTLRDGAITHLLIQGLASQ